MNQSIQILWEGYLSLGSVTWKYNPERKITLPTSLQNQCDKYWIKLKNLYPDVYDGFLLAVEYIEYQDNEIIFHLSSIRYSQVNFILTNNHQIENYRGSFGFQALIYNPSRTHVLIGTRGSTSDYRPGALGSPGGIFEAFDTKGSITDACIREIQEETYLTVKPETMRLLAIYQDTPNPCVGLITEVESLKDFDAPIIKGNEEWEGKELRWYPISKLPELSENMLMHSLLYARNLELEMQ